MLGRCQQRGKTQRFLCTFNPKGIVSSSPGLRGTSYPGWLSRSLNNPFGVDYSIIFVSQGSSFLATLGFVAESRWDSQNCSP